VAAAGLVLLALGQFCLVGLRVENTGAEGRTFGGGQQYLFDQAGHRHDPDLDATARLGGSRLWSTHLNPGQRLAGTLVYDVPEGVVLARSSSTTARSAAAPASPSAEAAAHQ
jgi:hypothetical protein